MKNFRQLAVLVCATAALNWAGCTSYREHSVVERTDEGSPIQMSDRGFDTVGRRWGQNEAKPEAPAPAQVAEAPSATPPETPAPAPSRGTVEINTGLVNLSKTVPAQVALGEEYTCNLTATAVEEAGFVVVTDEIPEGATYVGSEPPATREGNLLTWKFPAMKKGETQPIKVMLKADHEGELSSCMTVHATPRECVSTLVGKPALAIEKTGPATAKLDSDVTYTIVVSNKGTMPAKNVVVTDPVPEGMTHASGQTELSFNVGDLAPNQSATIPVTFKATRRGNVVNHAVASSSNTGKVNAEAPTTIVQQLLQVEKTGIKEQFLGRTAEYQIVVSNPGDTSLKNVVVTDNAPAETKIVSAPDATIDGNTAVWTLAELAAGDKKTFAVTLTTMTPGTHENGVTVATAEGLTGTSSAATAWRGVAGLLLQMVDSIDPVQVGEELDYIVTITNQGTAADGNIKPVVQFSPEIQPLSVTGDTAGTIQGQVVTFEPYPTLAPKQEIKWTIHAKGVATGDARTRVEFTSDLIKTPVFKEESTHVY